MLVVRRRRHHHGVDRETAKRLAREMNTREGARMRRDYRRKWLTLLGWQVLQDNVVFAPGDDPDDWTEMHSLTTVARVAGLPDELSELMLWRPQPGWRPRPTRRPQSATIEDEASHAVGETWTEPIIARAAWS
jgi:hypothetical protein